MNIYYGKLFVTLFTSSLWQESMATRLVFITLIVGSDKDGNFMGSVPGLAHLANVPLEDCKTAIDKLLSPDPYSRTIDKDGRRIDVIDGGWRVINKAKYRWLFSADERREQWRKSKQRKRLEAKDQLRLPIDKEIDKDESINVHYTDTDTDTDNTKEKSTKKERSTDPVDTPEASARRQKPAGYIDKETKLMAEAIYAEYPRKIAKVAAIKAIAKQLSQYDFTYILEQTKLYAKAREGCDHKFTPYPSTWFNQERFTDDPSAWDINGNEPDPWKKD